uniref:ATP synthase F0 subunit 8 n=1 Tax=Panagrolaimus superbus TaxID=310955 RepID=A0A914Y6U7_9BILA
MSSPSEDHKLSMGSPLAIFVIVSMFLYWIISAIVLFLLHRFGSNRKTKKSMSEKSYKMQKYERGLSRDKNGVVAIGI